MEEIHLRRRRYDELRRRRILAAIPGGVLGLAAGLIVSHLVRGVYISRLTLLGCLAGIALALYLGERTIGLPTEDDLYEAQFEEAMSPLGITSALKEESEALEKQEEDSEKERQAREPGAS
jgi:hypothetical protein